MPILDQALHQLVARVELVGEVDLFTRQERTRLDGEERRGQHQKLSRDLDVEVLQVLEVLQVPLDHRGDLHVLDLNLLLPHEVQQEVHRAMEDPFKANSEALHARYHTPPVS